MLMLGEPKKNLTLSLDSFAEREGFEPPVPLGTTVFKTVVIDHSTISPDDHKSAYLRKRVQR